MLIYNLKDIFDVSVLQEIQDRFCESTGFSAVTVDYTGKPITRYSNFSSFCKLVRKNEKHLQICHRSDAYGGLEAARKGESHIYRCHSGLVDMAVPIVLNGQYLGAIMAGQVKMEESQLSELHHITEFSSGILEDEEIKRAYENIPVVSREKVIAAAKLMYVVSNYIVEKGALSLMQEKLASKNKELIEEIKVREELEKALKNSEMKALQLQIKPHFMFNVLDNIASLAMIENAEKTRELVYLFAEIMRYIVRNVDKIVKVSEEIDEIERYLKIQSIRFGSKINYKIDIDENIKDACIPSMIIQPFVENSVIHGVEQKEGPSLIEILGYSFEENIIFEVKDNGVGMTNKRLKEVMELNEAELASGRSTGLGISNVNKRIMYTYGSEYKVNIKSNPNMGTTIIIKIPKIFT